MKSIHAPNFKRGESCFPWDSMWFWWPTCRSAIRESSTNIEKGASRKHLTSSFSPGSMWFSYVSSLHTVWAVLICCFLLLSKSPIISTPCNLSCYRPSVVCAAADGSPGQCFCPFLANCAASTCIKPPPIVGSNDSISLVHSMDISLYLPVPV